MNIQNLLKKISERRDKRKEGNNSKTSERLNKPQYDDTEPNYASIGMLNEMPNTQNDRSYFKQYFEDYATEERKETPSQEDQLSNPNPNPNINTNPPKPNKLELIENQLDQIEKMKSVFENKKRLETHGSIERACPNRSVEKHTLKPCQVPKFKQTSQFVVNPSSQLKEQNSSCLFKDESFSNHVNKTEEIISFKGAELFDDESREDSKRSISLRNQECWGKSKVVAVKLTEKCSCEPTLKDFMSEVSQKMAMLTMKITELESSNASLKSKHEKVLNSNLKAAQILQKLDVEKNELLETQEKWSQSKVELETLLKGVMIKKEKDVAKQNMSKQDCENYFKNKDKSKSPLKKNNTMQDKKPASKNKVESLLQRLQLRVQKS